MRPHFNCLFLVVLFFPVGAAQAHKASDSYLQLDVRAQAITGQWDLALRDLEAAVGLDANDDGQITWGELKSRQSEIVAYAFAGLKIGSSATQGSLRLREFLVDQHTDGGYAVLRFGVEGLHHPGTLDISYDALFDIDPQHRGLLRLEVDGQTHLCIFSPEQRRQCLPLARPAGSRQVWPFIQEGVWHLWTGYDHLLFLFALLLPSVLHRTSGVGQTVANLRAAIGNVVKIVTAFTLAHSLTLSLATLQIVSFPARLIESAIAASIIVAAARNLFSFSRGPGWAFAFGFGLIHGFGFANVLLDLALPSVALAWALAGFNFGVEIGQLAVVALIVPIAFRFRGHRLYHCLAVRFGSAAIALLAAVWMVERVCDAKWLPF